MKNELKEFLSSHKVLQLIDDQKYMSLYNLAARDIPWQIGNMTLFLENECNIYPCEHIGRLPPYYLYSTIITSYKVREGVTEIMHDAFTDCYELKLLELPQSLKSIDNSALDNCYELQQIIYHGTKQQWMQTIRHNAFSLFKSTNVNEIQCEDGVIKLTPTIII